MGLRLGVSRDHRRRSGGQERSHGPAALSVVSGHLHRLAARWASAYRLGERWAAPVPGGRRLSDKGWNEIVVDGCGNAYVNGGGFDLMAGEKFAPGIVALVTPAGSARQVADGIAFPNCMAVTPDNSTLIVAESYAKRLTAFDIAADGSLSNRRVWADLGDGVPDGICIDAEGAVWYADVPKKRCVRVREGGEVLQTVNMDLGCFACMLGGVDKRTLFMVVSEWRGLESTADGARTGQVLTVNVSVPGAGWP